MKKFLTLLSLFNIILLLNGFSVSAQEEIPVKQLECQVLENDVEYNSSVRSTTFIDTTVSVGYSQTEGMIVYITTSMNTTASVVGVKDIEIQIENGNDWVTVATCTGGESNNTTSCIISLIYPDPIEGKKYRVVCTHYGNVDGYRELYHETNGFKCVY